MFLTILVAFISLIALMVLHEFGHFVLAKRFGVKVEEFGIGYPPRIFGKRIGETIYSLNLVPFGAFVKIPGEIEKTDDHPDQKSRILDSSRDRSFSSQSVWKRMVIALGGVLSFWIIAAIIFSIVFTLGVPTAIEDGEEALNSKVQITAVASGSPAEKAGLKIGDTMIKAQNSKLKTQNLNKVSEVQEFTESNKGQELVLTIERGKETLEISLVPRVSPPEGEGAMGLALARTTIKNYPWYKAPFQGILATFKMTIAIFQGFYQAILNAVQGVPIGVQFMGPVGIGSLFYQAAKLGINYYLNLLALISIYIAIFNVLPIPSADGGKLLFLSIEAVRKKPISEKREQNITSVCFSLLILLMILVTIKDIAKLF